MAADLEHVPLPSDGLQPLLVQFTNGCLTADRKGKKKHGLEFSYYRWKDSTDDRKKDRRILTANSDSMEYSGHNFGQFSRANNLCKYLIGVVDNETGKMKMYDTKCFTMQPKVFEAFEVEEDEPSQDLSYLEKTDRLTEAFGSSKKKRLVVSRKKHLINKEELNSAVTDAVQGTTMDAAQEEDVEEGTNRSSTIPPFNIKALAPSDVYNIDDIISPWEYNTAKYEATELQGANKKLIEKWRAEAKFPEYILQHAAVMPLTKPERDHKSCLLQYLSYLMRMFQMNHTVFKKKDPLYGYPDVVKDRLLSTFTLENPKKTNQRLVPKRLKDKLLSYILVLALFIDNFVVDCTVIAKDLKLNPKRVSNHLRVLGCNITTSGSSNKRKADGTPPSGTVTATLSVPLPSNFPNIGIN